MRLPRDYYQYMRWITSFVDVSGGSVVLAGENPDRVVLVLGLPVGISCNVAPIPYSAGVTGFGITGANQPLVLTFSEHGTLPGQEWRNHSTALGNMTVIEGIIERSPCEKRTGSEELSLREAIDRSLATLQNAIVVEGS